LSEKYIAPEKLCNKCKQIKLGSEFFQSLSSASGLSTYCKICDSNRKAPEQQKAYMQEYDRRPGRKQKAKYRHRMQTLLKCYNLSIEQYEAILEAQNGVCAICGEVKPYSLWVDHDHVTMRVRGLLCRECNTGIGHLKDSVEVVASALRYLSEEQEHKHAIRKPGNS
jgi:hypothetical protein